MGKIGTWAQWQADNSVPDSGSSLGSNPNLNLSSGDCTLNTAMPITGIDQSATFTQLLKRGATWSVGVAPSLSGVHAPWSMGAFDVSGICADGFNLQGITLDGVTIN